LKHKLGCLAVLLFLGLLFWKGCLVTTNEIGYLGADKSGRQILIQSLDAVTQPKLRIDSDFFDHPLVLRLWSEPMRTTLRFDYRLTEAPHREEVIAYLNQPAEVLLSAAKGKISLREDWSLSPAELRELANKVGSQTVEDIYGGFGFKRLQVYHQGRPMFELPIRQKKPNVRWAGGQ
jgi:hypothetical protein